MAHEIMTTDNMLSVKETPWHGLGTVLDHAPTPSEAIDLAGLDWQVDLHTLQLAVTGQVVPAKVARAIVRQTDGKVLGIAGPQYKPFQNREAFAWFDPWVQAKQATIETAGSLRDGQIAWVLARIQVDPIEVVPGDVVLPFVLLTNRFDGKTANTAGFTPIRVVCSNTLAGAHASADSRLIRVRHTKKIVDAMEGVRASMDLVRREFAATKDVLQALARKGCDARDLRRYVLEVFAPEQALVEGAAEVKGVGATLMAEIQNGVGKKLMAEITPLFEKGRGNDMPGVRGTFWGAYNAVSEYLNHVRGKDASVRLANLWAGDAQKLNRRALEVGHRMAVAV